MSGACSILAPETTQALPRKIQNLNLRAACARRVDCAMDPSPEPVVKTPKVRRARSRVALVKSIWRAADAQVRDIEDRLVAAGQEPAERERDARMLAVLVKTLRELVAIDEERAAAKSQAESYDDDSVPRDIDEFRRELARKIDAVIAERTASSSGETE
jgi:hypothetical protein